MTMPSLVWFPVHGLATILNLQRHQNLALSSDNGRIRVSDLPEHLFTEQATDDVSATRLSTSLSFAEVEKRQLLTQPKSQAVAFRKCRLYLNRPHYAVAENEATWH